jgi:hypothetical protein
MAVLHDILLPTMGAWAKHNEQKLGLDNMKAILYFENNMKRETKFGFLISLSVASAALLSTGPANALTTETSDASPAIVQQPTLPDKFVIVPSVPATASACMGDHESHSSHDSHSSHSSHSSGL